MEIKWYFLSRARDRSKKDFQQTLLLAATRKRARGAAVELDEALAAGLTSVSEWAAEWQSLLPSMWPWRWR